MSKKFLTLIFTLLLFIDTIVAQPAAISSSDIQIGLQRLQVLGSVLYFAAHPDDENTRLIAWLAQDQKFRTGYLSLTRGDGGQNLIGKEIGIELGLIRTQELLAARGIDKGEQFFSSAYDFGFSKTHEETFAFWDKETALKEAVWIIRKYRPDVIINRFPPDKRGGHGHHQASAILSHEAYLAAADPTKFPEQLTTVQPWKAKRVVWNAANFGGMNNTNEEQLKVDIGSYSSLLGLSYGEIAAHSRSQHKSQGFGAATTRGSAVEYFEHVAGDKAISGLLDGVNTTWKRLKGTQAIETLIEKINKEFQPLHPEKSIPELFALRQLINNLPSKKLNDSNEVNYWVTLKTKEINELIKACAGLWINATTAKAQYSLNENIEIKLETIIRRTNNTAVKIIAINNNKTPTTISENTLWSSSTSYNAAVNTQPYWLIQPHSLGKFSIDLEDVGFPTNPKKPELDFIFLFNKDTLHITQPIQYRYVDPVFGEIHQPIAILPELSISLGQLNVLKNDLTPQKVEVNFERHYKSIDKYTVNIPAVNGWEVSPRVIELDFSEDNTLTKEITIKPISVESTKANIKFVYNNSPLTVVKTIEYNHIPAITWFAPAEIKCQYINLINPIKKVGYIEGAGDLVGNSLQSIGIETVFLNTNDITLQNIQNLDAIVVGVRYANVNASANKVFKILNQYVNNGGVVLIQYHVNSKLFTENLGPYSFKLSRDRVTEENAEVRFDANDKALQYPNKITTTDFEDWVQERGLYFASAIDKNYRTPINMNDKGEASHNGSLLITNYGKGKFVYTSLSFFRQLPAGVPGAYRLFVNLLSKEK